MYKYIYIYILYTPCNLTLSHDFIWVNYKALTRQGQLAQCYFLVDDIPDLSFHLPGTNFEERCYELPSTRLRP